MILFLEITHKQNIKLEKMKSAFRRLCDTLGYTKRYEHNKRNKKNIHSIRAFCATQYEEGTKSERLAHGYIGHKRYLEQYLRQSDEKKILRFRQTEPFLSLYNRIEVVDQSEELQKLRRELEEQKRSKKEEIKELVTSILSEDFPTLYKTQHNSH